MMRSAAEKTAAAADVLLDWLRTQAAPSAVHDKPVLIRPGPEEDDSADAATRVAQGLRFAEPEDRAPAPRQTIRLAQNNGNRGTPLRLAHTDWLHHRLTIAGPAGELADFRAAAAGAGTIPWHLHLDRIEEDCFHLLVAPPPLPGSGTPSGLLTPPGSQTPQRRTLSLAGARILARELRCAVARRHELAVARVGCSRACPFDLHALVPVPDAVLRLSPDDPAALAWLWEHWGTTHALRHVAEDAAAAERRQPGEARLHLIFWSADWTPWRALARIAARWPVLRFETRPTYGVA